MQAAASHWTHPPRWYRRQQLLRHRADHAPMRWLMETGSLTLALQRHAQAQGLVLWVDVLNEGWQRPHPEERARLGLDHAAVAWVREVCLMAGDHRWVLARSVLPRESLTGMGRRLTRLGDRSLGSVLFKLRGLTRGPITIAQVQHGSASIWARRSTLELRDHPLLVAEAFLPALFDSSFPTRTAHDHGSFA